MASSEGTRVQDEYIFGRNDTASTRLNYQHFWTTNLVKHLLHPAIKIDSSDMRIADIGTGTGVWLIDLAGHLPLGTHFYGFDISSHQFPRSEWLPGNVKLVEQDAFMDWRSEWRGKFDIVNIRFMITLTGSQEKYRRLIENARSLLKPSGYLQWLDLDPHSVRALSPDSINGEEFNADETSRSTTAKIARLMQKPQEMTDYSYFPIEAQGIVRKYEFQIITQDVIPIGPAHRSFWNQSNLLALNEVITGNDRLHLAGVCENTQMLDGLRREYEQGWSIAGTFFNWVLHVETT